MARPKKSRDQRRKDKKAKKAGKSGQGVSLAYAGDKYKRADLAKLWLETETAIYELYVMTGRKMLDRTVYSAVETLVKKLRAKTLSPLPEGDLVFDRERVAEFLIDNIRRHWELYFERQRSEGDWYPSEADCIGVLRSILGTIELVKVREPQSQRYLKYIAEFLTKKAGVSVNLVSDDEEPQAEQPPTLGNLRP